MLKRESGRTKRGKSGRSARGGSAWRADLIDSANLVAIKLERLRDSVESALGWPAGACAKLREITEREFAREEAHKLRAHNANLAINLSDLYRLVGVPFPAPQGTLCKPPVANTSQVDNQKDNAKPKTKGRR
jgi:hypothetical protein